MGLSLPTPPELLSAHHARDLFRCGVDSLDEWLIKRALANQISGASRTYVMAVDHRVIGYYSLASASLSLKEAPGWLRRNMPDPVPMILLGRLAVDTAWHGRGLGGLLLQDAVLRAQQAAGIIGIRGMLVHPISGLARNFYLSFGFAAVPLAPQTLVLSLKAADD